MAGTGDAHQRCAAGLGTHQGCWITTQMSSSTTTFYMSRSFAILSIKPAPGSDQARSRRHATSRIGVSLAGSRCLCAVDLKHHMSQSLTFHLLTTLEVQFAVTAKKSGQPAGRPRYVYWKLSLATWPEDPLTAARTVAVRDAIEDDNG